MAMCLSVVRNYFWMLFVDFCRQATTGVNRQAITIEPGLFSAADSVNTYYLYVKVKRPNSINFGE